MEMVSASDDGFCLENYHLNMNEWQCEKITWAWTLRQCFTNFFTVKNLQKMTFLIMLFSA